MITCRSVPLPATTHHRLYCRSLLLNAQRRTMRTTCYPAKTQRCGALGRASRNTREPCLESFACAAHTVEPRKNMRLQCQPEAARLGQVCTGQPSTPHRMSPAMSVSAVSRLAPQQDSGSPLNSPDHNPRPLFRPSSVPHGRSTHRRVVGCPFRPASRTGAHHG